MFGKNVLDTQKWLEQKLERSSDVENSSLRTASIDAKIMYIKSVCTGETINQYIIKPFFNTGKLDDYEQYLRSFPSCKEPKG